MNTFEYEQAAMRTAKDMGSKKSNLLHAALGLCGEAGEFGDAVKKFAIYGKELDYDNAMEELGDVLWFVALGCRSLGVSMEAVMCENIQKLKARYPEKYSDALAVERLDKAPVSSHNEQVLLTLRKTTDNSHLRTNHEQD